MRLAGSFLLFLVLICGASIPVYQATIGPFPKNLPDSLIYTPNLTDAVWFAVQTVTTTGYGSLPDRVWDNSPKLKWASVGLMLTGGIAWAFMLGVAIAWLIEKLRE